MLRKQKKVKLFLHHGLSQDFSNDAVAANKHRAVLRPMLVRFLKIIEQSCFTVGMGIVVSVRAGYRAAHTSVRAGVETGQAFARAFIIREVRRTMYVFVLFAAIAISFLQAGPLASQALQLKSRVLGVTDSGIGSLSEAQSLLEQQQIGSAQTKFIQALQNFNQSKTELDKAGSFINSVGNLLPQKRQGESLLSAAQHISQAGVEFTTAYGILDQLQFSAQGIEAKNGGIAKNSLQSMEKHMVQGLTYVEQANIALEAGDGGVIPEKYRAQFAEAKTQLDAISSSLSAFKELVSITNQILLGQKEVLLLLQNNNELRPTGGFIGTYGAMQLNDGKIDALHISSIYDLDGQLGKNNTIIPPHPLYAINNRWYMRDSNWFADFPESAKKITSFYEKEGGESPDLIVAVTPNIVTDLISLTGPITLPKYGVTLTSDNFVELTQIATSVTYDREQNTPKQLLADFFPILLQRLSELKADQYIRVAELFQKNLNSKNIILFSRDPELQAKLSSYNWTGEIKETDRDYLSIVSTNLSATKTDLYIKQTVTLDSEIREDGTIQNKLTISRSNPLPNQPQYKNNSFIRIFVPKGAKLESSEGFTFTPMEVPPLSDAKQDDDVAAWEDKLLKNVATGTMIGEEAGKTFFANWIDVAGGETKQATVTYTLPFTLKSLDRHSLLLQKQGGAVPYDLTFTLSYPQWNLVWKNAASGTTEAHSTKYTDSISKDEFFGVVVKK